MLLPPPLVSLAVELVWSVPTRTVVLLLLKIESSHAVQTTCAHSLCIFACLSVCLSVCLSLSPSFLLSLLFSFFLLSLFFVTILLRQGYSVECYEMELFINYYNYRLGRGVTEMLILLETPEIIRNNMCFIKRSPRGYINLSRGVH